MNVSLQIVLSILVTSSQMASFDLSSVQGSRAYTLALLFPDKE